MIVQNEDNGGLYFIVGALVVAVAIIGFMYFNNAKVSNTLSPTVIERTEKTIEKTAEPAPSTNSYELKIDDNGASATHTETP